MVLRKTELVSTLTWRNVYGWVLGHATLIQCKSTATISLKYFMAVGEDTKPALNRNLNNLPSFWDTEIPSRHSFTAKFPTC